MNKLRSTLAPVVLAIACLYLTGCFIPGVTLNGRYTEEKEWSFTAAGIAAINAETTNGEIVVDASNTTEIKVHAEKTIRALTDEKAKEYAAEVILHAELEGNALQVYYDQPKGWKQVQVDVDYAIVSPPSVDLMLRTTNGNVQMAGTDKAVEAHSTNGDVTLSGGNGSIILRSTNGNVSAVRSVGKIEASTTNGEVNVNLDSLVENADVSTTNGGVQLEIQKGCAPIRATSTNGSISVTLPGDFSGQLDASTTNGSVSSEFPIPNQKPSKKNLKGPIGQGGANEVYLKTTNASITIKKQNTR